MNNRFSRYALIWIMLIVTIYVGDQFIRGAFLTADDPRPVTARGSLAESEQSTISLFEAVAPSVVYIVTDNGDPRGGGAGSGLVWDRAGHVVTNHHVVAGARSITVRLDTGESVNARLVGSSTGYDLAVVQLSGTRASLRPILVGQSANLKVGQSVFAIGNPFGLSRTLTSGIISALNRRLPTADNREIAGVIQTDASINPGNSGGPLVDSAGLLIGVNTAIISGTNSSAGIGFAVPVDIVNQIVPQLIKTGHVPRPGIGITVLPEEVAARIGVNGLIIADVLSGSAAQKAGLRGVDEQNIGDVITHVNGQPVRTLAEFAAALGKVGVGSRAELTVRRDRSSRAVLVEVIDIS